MKRNPYARPPRTGADDDATDLAALSLLDDWDMTYAAIAREFGLSRNTALGRLLRIIEADADEHGLPCRHGDLRAEDMAALRAHRRQERALALPAPAPGYDVDETET